MQIETNKLHKWLLGISSKGYTEQHKILKETLMPYNTTQDQKDLLLYLYTNLILTSPEGVALLHKKDMYNSYDSLSAPHKLVSDVDLLKIADNIENQHIINTGDSSTFIDVLYEALIYILDRVL